METLSVKQPWASLIVCGAKDVENRTWTTPYRGRLLIHASGDPYLWPDDDALPESYSEILNAHLGPDADLSDLPAQLSSYHGLCLNVADHYGLLDQFYTFEESELPKRADQFGPALDTHQIVGEVTLVDVVKNHPSPWAEPGQFHFVLEKPIQYDNTIKNVRGKLRIWQYQGGTT